MKVRIQELYTVGWLRCVVAKAKQFKIKMQWWIRGELRLRIGTPRLPRVSGASPTKPPLNYLSCTTCGF